MEFSETFQEASTQRPLPTSSFVFFGSVGKPRWLLCPLLGWYFLNFFSATAGQNSTKLNRAQDLNVMKLDKKQDVNVIYQSCFSGRSQNQDDRPSLWFAEIFWTYSPQLLSRNKRALTGSKISTSSPNLAFCGPIEKSRWSLCPLLGWYIFYLFSAIDEQNSTKLNRAQDVMKLVRKEDVNVIYQVCVFLADWETQFGRPILWFAETCLTYSPQQLNRNKRTLTGRKISTSSCIFPADRKTQMVALSSAWLIHFGLLLCNRWTDFNETWQEAIWQCLLLSLYF